MNDRDVLKWLSGLLVAIVLLGSVAWMTAMHRTIRDLQRGQATPMEWKVEGDKIVLAIRELEAHHEDHEAEMIEKLDAILEAVTGREGGGGNR